jgi:hypothetical protein
MTSHVSDDAVVDLALGAGTVTERAHAGSCAACSRRVEQTLEALELTRRGDVREPPPLYWQALRRSVGRRIAEDGHRTRRLAFLVPLAAAAAVAAVLLAGPATRRKGPSVVEPRVAAWTALPAEDNDDGLLVLEGLALTDAGLPDWDASAGLETYLAGLTDDESRVLAETLRESGQGGES